MTVRVLSILLSVLWISCTRPDLHARSDVRQLARTYREILDLKIRLGKPDGGLTADAFRTQTADVLRKHGYKPESFQEALADLRTSPDLLKAFTDDVIAQQQTAR